MRPCASAKLMLYVTLFNVCVDIAGFLVWSVN